MQTSARAVVSCGTYPLSLVPRRLGTRLVPPLPMLSCLHLCRCYSVASVPWYQRKVATVIFATPPSSSYEEVGEPLWSRSHALCIRYGNETIAYDVSISLYLLLAGSVTF